jgi:hypothetical protein
MGAAGYIVSPDCETAGQTGVGAGRVRWRSERVGYREGGREGEREGEREREREREREIERERDIYVWGLGFRVYDS